MIRLGRSAKPEQSETTGLQTTSSNEGYQSAPAAASTRAVTESEAMARDIKEGRLSGFVGYGTALQGETTFQAMLRVDGHLTGRVTSETGTLIVGSTGRVDANVLVAAAVIGGTVNGDIIATERLELGRSAHVIGNIQTPRLVVEDGAVLEGSCVMMKARESLAKRAAETEAAHNYSTQSDETTETSGYIEAAEDDAGEEIYDAAAR